QSWKLMWPSVVSAVKSGAVSPMDRLISFSFRKPRARYGPRPSPGAMGTAARTEPPQPPQERGNPSGPGAAGLGVASRESGRAPSGGAARGWQVGLLGRVEVVGAGRPVRLPGPKPVTLLVLLAIHVGETVPAGRLIESLWAGQPPPSADAVLRTYVAQLRRALGAGIIETSADGYALRLDPVCVDARLFEQQLAQARAWPSPRRAEVTAAQLRRALALWRGPAFGELAPAAFAAAETQRLEELRLAAIEDRLDADLAAGRHATL